MDSENSDSDSGISDSLAGKLESALKISGDDDGNGKDKKIKHSKTLSTATSFESQSSLSSLGTPRAQGTTQGDFSSAATPGDQRITTTEGGFTTPEDQKIETWEDMCLSPTMLMDHDKAMSLLKSDGADRYRFYRAAPRYTKACIHYIYGLGVYSDLDPDGRLGKLSRLVEKQDSRERLASIVLALPKDRFITAHGKAAYLQMAITSYLFSHHWKLPKHPKSRLIKVYGGFPNMASMLNQMGRNCFHPATCLWLSLILQLSENHDKILDPSQVARRHMMKHPDELEGRVIDNKGRNTLAFAQTVSNKTGDKNDFTLIDCSDHGDTFHTAFSVQVQLITEMERGKFGLITGFQITPEFKEAAHLHVQKQHDYKLGYYLFDADEETGKISYEWVSYEHYKDDRIFRQALKDLKVEITQGLQEQDEKEKKRREELKKTLEYAFPDEDGKNPDPSAAENDFTNAASSLPSPQSSGAHAMTMIACHHHKDLNKKATFLAINPWIEMPIVGATASYLRVCQSTVCFSSGSLNIDKGLDRVNTMVADCSSYEVVGGGDGADFPKDWLRDAFGCTSRPHGDAFEQIYGK
ncbi:MAG: hypothetical protein SGILL_009791 [Bacillariaceae sp.]